MKCCIKRESGKATFTLNGKPCSKKAVVHHARRFSIQIDNLCQFLPQDKVVEFAAMTPIDLLKSTQRAVASQRMIDWHDELKDLSSKRQKVAHENQASRETLESLENRQRVQEADVERVRERDKIKEKLEYLKAMIPLVKFREAKNTWTDAKMRRDVCKAEHRRLETEKAPALVAVNAKRTYLDAVKKGRGARRTAVDQANVRAKEARKKIQTLEAKIKEAEEKRSSELKIISKHRTDMKRSENLIVSYKKSLESPAVEYQPSLFNRRIVRVHLRLRVPG